MEYAHWSDIEPGITDDKKASSRRQSAEMKADLSAGDMKEKRPEGNGGEL